MSVAAYILMSVHLGKTQDVISELRNIPQITRVAVVTGEWDVVARIEVENLEELYNITSDRVHLIKGISETQTAIIEKELKNE